MPSRIVSLVVNGVERETLAAPGATLLSVVRDGLGLTAAKRGCGTGSCGACTVLVDDQPMVSCLVAAETVDGAEIRTLEGVAAPDGTLDEVQSAFLEGFATQCGFCTSGMILTAEALLDRRPDPTEDEVVEAISGQVCRCTGYRPIIDAVLAAAQARREPASGSDAATTPAVTR